MNMIKNICSVDQFIGLPILFLQMSVSFSNKSYHSILGETQILCLSVKLDSRQALSWNIRQALVTTINTT